MHKHPVSDHDAWVRPLDRARARARRPAPIYLGHSTATRQVQAQIRRALDTTEPVLISGAPGTGKRTIAEILHHFSGVEFALEQPQIVDGRVVALGEFSYVCPVERLTHEQQVALIDRPRSSRLILATRLQLDSHAAQRRLRPLLRGCSIHIELPTLRQRIEDLEVLALQILAKTPVLRPIGGIDAYALDCLRAHAWPGNVTEFEVVLRRAIEAGSSEQIELRDLPVELRLHAVASSDLDGPDLEFSLAHAERVVIERALRYARGNKRKAARLLQISKTTLYRKLQRYHAIDDEMPDDDV